MTFEKIVCVRARATFYGGGGVFGEKEREREGGGPVKNVSHYVLLNHVFYHLFPGRSRRSAGGRGRKTC